jgi:hypothetical protein
MYLYGFFFYRHRGQGVFDEVYLSFLIVGHTHFDPDQVFSRVATTLKSRNAFSVTDFISLLKQVSISVLVRVTLP